MLTNLGIFTEVELESRYEIALENYCKLVQVEALTSIKMVNNQIYPACIKYLGDIAYTAKNLSENNINNEFIIEDIKNLSNLTNKLKNKNIELEEKIKLVKSTNNIKEKANIIKNDILRIMLELRSIVDLIETKIDSKYWPMPTYTDLLFSM